MVSQMSVSSSLNISITTWSSAQDVRFRNANAISRTRSPVVTSCRFLGPVIHQRELGTARDGVSDVRIKFSEHLDHDLVFCTGRCSFPESEGNLSESLTINQWKGMKGFTRPSLLDPLRYFCVRRICEEFSEVFVRNSYHVFHFLSLPVSSILSKIAALVCGGGPFKWRSQLCRFFCTEVSLVSVSSFVVLCAVRWRESSVSRGLSDRVCAFRSSCRPPDRGKIFCFCGAPFHSRMCNCICNCTQKWSLLLQNRINS